MKITVTIDYTGELAEEEITDLIKTTLADEIVRRDEQKYEGKKLIETINEAAEREAFEKWCQHQENYGEHYINNFAWKAWQARAQQPTPACGDVVERVAGAMRNHEHFFTNSGLPFKSILTPMEWKGLAKAALAAMPQQEKKDV